MTLTQAEQERLYDLERSGQLYAKPEPATDALTALLEKIETLFDDDPTTLLSVAEQIALCGVGDEDGDIEIGTLPTGETIDRGIADGSPNEWIRITRGKVDIDVKAGGRIGGIGFAGCYLDEEDFTLQDLDDLRAILLLDRAMLGQIADLGPEVSAALAVWDSLLYDERCQAIDMVGFADWLHDPDRPRTPRPRPAKPPVEEQGAPVCEPDPTNIDYRAGAAAASLTFVLRKLSTDRADGLIALIDSINRAPAEQRDRMVDALLAA